LRFMAKVKHISNVVMLPMRIVTTSIGLLISAGRFH
jgi:hypothetical protein